MSDTPARPAEGYWFEASPAWYEGAPPWLDLPAPVRLWEAAEAFNSLSVTDDDDRPAATPQAWLDRWGEMLAHAGFATEDLTLRDQVIAVVRFAGRAADEMQLTAAVEWLAEEGYIFRHPDFELAGQE